MLTPAWVFGGMGSWNDTGFDGEDQNEHERVLEALFRPLNAAIVAGANASLVSRFMQRHDRQSPGLAAPTATTP